jgi:uncharacterized protein (TIGR02145 family)
LPALGNQLPGAFCLNNLIKGKLVTLVNLILSMKNLVKLISLCLFIFAIILHSCKKEELPTLSTTSITNITATSASSGGDITSDGGADLIHRGVCWTSGTEDPVVTDSHTSDGTGTGAFTSSLTQLTPNTKYRIRAYATNSAGTGYGNAKIFMTPAVIDTNGNLYNSVNIGTQTWMAENLKSTKFNNGDNIPNVTDSTAWSGLSTPAYCWWNNNAAIYKDIYGALYNWYAVSTGNLCPTGWHVPTDAEWTTLTDCLGGQSVAGGKLKATGTIEGKDGFWGSPNTGATNETGFTALPGSYRWIDGRFIDAIGSHGYWWSSSEVRTIYAWGRNMSTYDGNIYRGASYKVDGLSVRCLKD